MHGRVIHADKLVELLPALDLTCLRIAPHSCPRERRARSAEHGGWHIKAKVVIVESTTLALHVVDLGDVAKSAKLQALVKDLVHIGTVVADSLFAAAAIAEELFDAGLDVLGRLALDAGCLVDDGVSVGVLGLLGLQCH